MWKAPVTLVPVAGAVVLCAFFLGCGAPVPFDAPAGFTPIVRVHPSAEIFRDFRDLALALGARTRV